MNQYKQGSGNKVNTDVNSKYANTMANKLCSGFDKGEVIQVTENYMDAKTQQELVDLMNALFDERSRALRKFMFELMTQKTHDIEDLQAEFEPQKEMLRNKRKAELLSDEDFTRQMERLNTELAERKLDIEIEYSDKEKEYTEELEKIKLDAESEQKKLLKDRQT